MILKKHQFRAALARSTGQSFNFQRGHWFVFKKDEIWSTRTCVPTTSIGHVVYSRSQKQTKSNQPARREKDGYKENFNSCF